MDEFDQLITIFNNPIKKEVKKQLEPYIIKFCSLDDIKNLKNQTILHFFANNTKFKHISLLISYFMTTNHGDIDGNIPLHFASKNPDFFIILVENGCNYLYKNKDKITPLQLLVENSSFETFEFIINKLTYEIKSNLYDLLHYCIIYQKFRMIQYLFTKFPDDCIFLIRKTTFDNLFRIYANLCMEAPFLLSPLPEELQQEIVVSRFIGTSIFQDRISTKLAGIYKSSNYSTLKLFKKECPKLSELYHFLYNLDKESVIQLINNSDNKYYKDFYLNNETIIHKAASLSVTCLKAILTHENCNCKENPPIFNCFQNEKIDDALQCFIDVRADLNVRDIYGNDLLHYAIMTKSKKISYFIQNTNFNVYEDIKLTIELGNLDAIDEILDQIHLDSEKFQDLIDLLKVKTILEKFIEKSPNINKLDILKWAFERRNFFIVYYFLYLENSAELRTSNNDNIFHVIASSYDSYIDDKNLIEIIKEKSDGSNLLNEQNNDKKTPIDLFFKYYNTKFLNFTIPLLKEYNFDNLRQFLKHYRAPDTKINGKHLIFYYVENIDSDSELLKCLQLFKEYNCKFTVCYDHKYPIYITLERNFTKCSNFLFEHGSLSVSNKFKFNHPVCEYSKGRKSSNYSKYVRDKEKNLIYFEPISYDNFRSWLAEDYSKITKDLICFMLEKGPDQDELVKCLSYIEYLSKQNKLNEKFFSDKTVKISNEFYQISAGRNMIKVMKFIKETESLEKYVQLRLEYVKREQNGLDLISDLINEREKTICNHICYKLSQYRCIIKCQISMIKAFSDNIKFGMDVTPLFGYWMKYQDCHFSTTELLLKHIIDLKTTDAVNIYCNFENIFNKRSRLFSKLLQLSIGDKMFDECSEKYNDFEMKSCHFVNNIINQKLISNYILLREIGIFLPNVTKIELFFRSDESILVIDNTAAYIGNLIDVNHVLFKKILKNGSYDVKIKFDQEIGSNPTGIRISSIEKGSNKIYFDGTSRKDQTYDDFDFKYSLGVYYKTHERSILFKK